MDTSSNGEERRNVERIFARAFTVLGGLFWIAASFAGPLVYQRHDIVSTFIAQGMYPLAFTFAVLAIGWYYERLAALILALGALGTVAWGLINGSWEPMVWGIMLTFFVAPTVVAATLYFLADSTTPIDSEPVEPPRTHSATIA